MAEKVFLGATSAAASLNQVLGQDIIKVARAKYNFAVDGGVAGAITPAVTEVIPINAILIGGQVYVKAAVTSSAGANVSIGTTAGSSATSILGATAKGSLTLAALLNVACTFAAAVRMTAAGSIKFTIDTTDLTAGIIEVFVFYVECDVVDPN